MNLNTACLLAITSTLLGLRAPAQTFLSVPLHADSVDGHRSLELPFGVPGFRTQILVDKAHIAANGAVLNGIRFRADRGLSGSAGQVPNVTIELSQTPVQVGLLSTAFAVNTSNASVPPTVVFQGTVTLPQPPAGFAGPLPWDVVIPFTQPHSFTTAQGNLLIDIIGNNPVGGTPTYFLDAVQAGGSATEFGTLGLGPIFGALLMQVSNSLAPRTISPGHTLTFIAMEFTNPAGGFAIGVTGLPAPIDLGPLGAPMNSLYIAPLVLEPYSWLPTIQGFAATSNLAVPNNTALVGATLYAQRATLVPAANPLGLVTSHALEVRLGDEFEVLPLQQLDSNDPNAAIGALADFGGLQPEFGAVAIRFDGVFF